MEVIFAGVGEAFDELLPNTSLLVLAGNGETTRQVLLDCGFTAPIPFWNASPDPLALDAVWVSHFHGDHYFGLPLLILRFWEQRRSRPLCIVGPPGCEQRVKAAMDLAYGRLLQKLPYALEFSEASPGKDLDLLGFRWSFAESGHSSLCLAVRLDHGQASLFYSGDGRPTGETRALARSCDLVVHEAFELEHSTPGHGTVDQAVEMAREAQARALALVHLNRNMRRQEAAEVRRRLAAVRDLRAFLPEPGDRLQLPVPAPRP